MRTRILLVIVLVAGILFYFGRRLDAPTLAIGQPIPSFTLQDEQHHDVSPQQYQGSVLLVNFWATTCAACAEEIPSLNRLHAQLAGRRFEILAISEDGEMSNPWDAITRYRERIPLEFPILLDPTGHVADQYGTYMIPESYLVDRTGRLVRKITGAIQWDHPEVLAEIERLF